MHVYTMISPSPYINVKIYTWNYNECLQKMFAVITPEDVFPPFDLFLCAFDYSSHACFAILLRNHRTTAIQSCLLQFSSDSLNRSGGVFDVA
ncbi:hypothetical protein Trydic_g9089 [Trypoxylus dichotomus]